MNEQQAEKMISLLESILSELKDIAYSTDATKSEVNDAVGKLDDVKRAVEKLDR